MPTSFQQSVIEEFRANAGKVGGPFEGSDLLLLTTTGAKSGREHTVPLGYVHGEGGDLLVVGSAGGSDRHPAWYHNLLAHPLVGVEVGTATYGAVAVPAQGARREELFARVVDVAPGYADYQAKTTRTLPVVQLQRSDPEDAPAPRTLAGKLLEVHDWLRAQLAHVQAEADAHLAAHGSAPAPTGLGLQLRQHCLAFCQSLEFHHTSEDGHMLPALAAQNPRLRDVFDRLTAEHRTVARLKTQILTLLDGADEADPQRLRAELADLSGRLTAHLDYEEEWLLPLLREIPMPPTPPGP